MAVVFSKKQKKWRQNRVGTRIEKRKTTATTGWKVHFSTTLKFYIMNQVKFQPMPFGGLISQLAHTAMNQLNDRFEPTARPAVNVLENEDGYELQIAAPGFAKDEFSVNVEADLLTVTAKKAENKETSSEKWQRREFGTTQMSRSFHLPETVDADKISAAYENGVLKLSLLKKEEVKPAVKTIQIA